MTIHGLEDELQKRGLRVTEITVSPFAASVEMRDKDGRRFTRRSNKGLEAAVADLFRSLDRG